MNLANAVMASTVSYLGSVTVASVKAQGRFFMG